MISSQKRRLFDALSRISMFIMLHSDDSNYCILCIIMNDINCMRHSVKTGTDDCYRDIVVNC